MLPMDDAALNDSLSMISICSIPDEREDHISERSVAITLPIDVWSIIFSRLDSTVDLMAAASVCRRWR